MKTEEKFKVKSDKVKLSKPMMDAQAKGGFLVKIEVLIAYKE